MKFKIGIQKNKTSKRFWSNTISNTVILILFTLLIFIPVSVQAAKATDFIPQDSVLYLQLNDLNEIYNEIKMSDLWEETIKPQISESEMNEIQNGLMLAQNVIGTDVYTVIETVGYQIGAAVWTNEIGNPHGGIVINSGGNLADLKRFTKILTGFIGMSGEGRLVIDAGEYRKVKYDTLQMPDLLLIYGFVGDFLIVGIGENSFEKLIDTYRNKNESILQNESYLQTSKSLESGQVNLYLELGGILPNIGDIEEEVQKQLDTFTNIGAALNLLESGPILQLYTKFNPNLPESLISKFLKEGTDLSTLKGMSGNEDLFISVAPGILETVWELIHQELENSETDDAYAFITFMEGLLNLNFEEDVIAGLTGEIALSVDDLTRFEPDAIENLNVEFFDSFYIDAANVHTNGGLIFHSAKADKWEQIGNSLSNLQNTSVSKTEYKDIEISVFASNIHYAEKDGLSLLSFSEDQMISMIDGIDNRKKLSYMKKIPAKLLAFAKIDLMNLLLLASEGILGEDETFDEIPPILAWITVKEDVAKFEVSVSEKESPLEVFLKLALLLYLK